MSVVGDDVGGCEMREIDIGFKDERVGLAFLDAPVKGAGQGEVKRLAAVGTPGLYLDGQGFIT